MFNVDVDVLLTFSFHCSPPDDRICAAIDNNCDSVLVVESLNMGAINLVNDCSRVINEIQYSIINVLFIIASKRLI